MVKQDTKLMFLIGDLHFGVHVNSLEWIEYQRRYILDSLIPTFEYYNSQNIPYTVWQLGDVFEHKLSLNVNILNQVVEIFEKLMKVIPEMHIVLGNHDTYYIDRNHINSPTILANSFDNLHIHREPEELLVNDNYKFLLLPWMKSNEELNTAIAASDAKYLLTHIDINDFKYPSGIEIKDHIDRESLTQFNRIYSGHIHLRQQSGNTMYIGTPYHLDYSDRNDEKGIYMLEFKDDDYIEHFIPNTISPTYKDVYFRDLIEVPQNLLSEKFGNSFLHIKTPIDVFTDIDVAKTSEYLKENITDLRKLKFDQFNVDTGLDDMEEEEISETLDIFEIARELMKKSEINNKESKNVLSIMNVLYDEAKIEMKDDEEG